MEFGRGTGAGIDPPCIRLFFGVARASGWTCCTRGWGRSDDRRNTRDVLGWIGHGDDRRHRLAIWSSCMSRTGSEVANLEWESVDAGLEGGGNSDFHFR